MGTYYDNSIVPDHLKRKFDVYDRIKKLSIDMGSFDADVADLKGAGIAGIVFHESGLVFLSGQGGGPGQMYDDPARIKEGADAAEEIADSMIKRLHWGLTCGGEGGDLNDVISLVTALGLVGEIAGAAGVDIHFLDVGGGFPAAYKGVVTPPLSAYMDEIDAGLAGLELRRDCVTMCEPGRAMVASGCSLVVQVLLRKEDQIYINDGVHGSLSEMVTGPLRMPVRLIRLDGDPSDRYADFAVAGPTCDSVDMLPFPFRLPEDIREGDWLEIGQLGAYGSALRTQFNGFYPDTFVTLRDEPFIDSPSRARSSGA